MTNKQFNRLQIMIAKHAEGKCVTTSGSTETYDNIRRSEVEVSGEYLNGIHFRKIRRISFKISSSVGTDYIHQWY